MDFEARSFRCLTEPERSAAQQDLDEARLELDDGWPESGETKF